MSDKNQDEKIKQLEETISTLHNEVETLKTKNDIQIANSDKLLNAYSGQIEKAQNMQSNQLTYVNIVITTLGITFAILGFFGFVNIKNTIDEKVSKTIDSHIITHSEKLQKQINEFAEIKQVWDNQVNELMQKAKEDLTKVEKDKLDIAIKNAESKENKTFNDWLKLAYNSDDLKKQIDLYTKAINKYDETIDTQLGLALAYYGRGASKSLLKQYKEAIKDLDKSIEYNPENDFSYYTRGASHTALKQYKEAIKDYEKLIEFDPDNEVIYIRLLELGLVSDIEVEQKYIDYYKENLYKVGKSAIYFDMIKILQKAKTKVAYKAELIKWRKTYTQLYYEGWSLHIIEGWSEGIADKTVKNNVKKLLKEFKKQWGRFD